MTAAHATYLRFENVGLVYPDGTAALSEVTFDVPGGQFCVVLGPSGSGKSTLLRTVNGLSAPTDGRVTIGGTPVDRASVRRLRPAIGMIHQHFGLVARASVAHNVIAGAVATLPFWRALMGVYPRALTDKACRLLAAVGLQPEHLVRRVGALSGGQQQRVGIARALMQDPTLILADEPAASLDPGVARDILRLIRREAATRGVTVLCTLHQVELAREFADRIVALQLGRVAFDGPPARFDRAAVERIYGSGATAASDLEPAYPALRMSGS
ncbi:MAG: phosphonate ABC transporter ATP-binding protein [Rhodospirillaceae bacterium]|nr:phosphonate ABC transporter ATP-binding protein [Rhodospirillaceae bacterium]